MPLKEPKPRPDLAENAKLDRAYTQFGQLITELAARPLPDAVQQAINAEVEELNAISSTAPELKKQIKKKQSSILKLIEKELKLVPKNHYRNTWTALGMSVFGLPLGVAFGASLGNMAFLAIGLPIGMVIGMAVGADMDQKAAEEGRQLDMESG